MDDLVELCTEYRANFPFFPWCLALHITLHWHPSVYSNGCDFFFLETSIKTSAVMRLLIPEDIPSRYCVTVCFVSLSAALLFGIRSINGCLFRRSRWSYVQQPLGKNILLCLHKQVTRFLGGENECDYIRYTLCLQHSNSCDLITQWWLVWN